jgi:hypothetical protein
MKWGFSDGKIQSLFYITITSKLKFQFDERSTLDSIN